MTTDTCLRCHGYSNDALCNYCRGHLAGLAENEARLAVIFRTYEPRVLACYRHTLVRMRRESLATVATRGAELESWLRKADAANWCRRLARATA